MSTIGLCSSCLRVDRNVSPLQNLINESIFVERIHSFMNNPTNQFCWECRAMLVKIDKFTTQLCKAQTVIEATEKHEIKFKLPESNLSIHTKNTYDKEYEEKDTRPTVANVESNFDSTNNEKSLTTNKTEANLVFTLGKVKEKSVADTGIANMSINVNDTESDVNIGSNSVHIKENIDIATNTNIQNKQNEATQKLLVCFVPIVTDTDLEKNGAKRRRKETREADLSTANIETVNISPHSQLNKMDVEQINLETTVEVKRELEAGDCDEENLGTTLGQMSSDKSTDNVDSTVVVKIEFDPEEYNTVQGSTLGPLPSDKRPDNAERPVVVKKEFDPENYEKQLQVQGTSHGRPSYKRTDNAESPAVVPIEFDRGDYDGLVPGTPLGQLPRDIKVEYDAGCHDRLAQRATLGQILSDEYDTASETESVMDEECKDDLQSYVKRKMSSDAGIRKRHDNDGGADFSNNGTSQNEIDEIKKRSKVHNTIKCQRSRDKKRATNKINLHTDQTSKTDVKHVFECQNFHNSLSTGPSTRNVPYDEEVDFSDDGTSQNEIDDIIERKKVQNKIRCQRYRDKKKKETEQNYKHRTITVEDEEEKIKRRKENDRLKSQRYRDKKRATNLIHLHTDQSSKTVVKHVSKCQNFPNSQIPGPSTRNVPFIPLIHTADLSTQNEPYITESRSDYNDDIHINTPSQDNYVTQLHEPIKTNYVLNSQTILPRDVQNNIQNSQLNLPIQTYSSFQQNSSAHREFQKDFYENEFGHACDICDRLWFKKDLKVVVNNDTTPNIKFIRTMLLNINIVKVNICSNCLSVINKNRVPPLSVYNGFKYPPFPENLKKHPLDLVTERLVSPRIPFMQIRRLRHIHSQFGIYGQVINVPIEVNTMVRSLPRNIDDDHSITVHIKRRKIPKSSYVYGIVNKRKMKAWLRYLKDTPLYTSYGITVDDSFLNGQDDAQDEIVLYDEDGDNEISEQILIDESLIAQQQTLMWNDEMYLRIAAGEGNVSVSPLFDEHAEELSFPQIYLGQLRTFRDGFTVTPFMLATSELRRSDRRGVSPQHLLYMAMKIIRIRIQESLIAFKHVGKGTTITKEQIESENCIQGCIESNLAFLRTIPNSAFYWSERKKDLFAMIRQYGKPTVFFTISANEIGWSRLIQLLYNLKNNSEISLEDVETLHFIEKSTLVNEDAVTCAIYFNKLVNVLMKILQSKRFSPLKKYRILHYFKRIEFQHGGSPCAHILAWLDNAPEDALEKDYNKAIDLIDLLMSVSAAEASGNIKLQTHKHTFTCYKGKASEIMQRCRFEAPFIPIKTTMILTPMNDTEDGFKEYKAKYNALRNNLENYDYDDFQTFYRDNNINSDQEYVNIIRAGINRPRVFPKRKPHEKWHYPFNPFILNIVKSNTDFQFITEEYSCAAFIVEYVNKANRGVSNLQRKLIEIMDEHPEFDIFEITKNISINLLNHTEITTQEAAWYLLREPMSRSSTMIVYIPTVWPIERQRIKKTMKELSELDDDCTDIWKENWFDKYEKRPEDLENISLAQFVSNYYKNNKGEYVKRDEPRVIRYRNYDMATDLNEYKREMVTLHIPFRNEEAEILEEIKFIRLYDENVDLILQKRKEFESIDIERTLQICRELCLEEVSCDNEKIRDVGRLPY